MPMSDLIFMLPEFHQPNLQYDGFRLRELSTNHLPGGLIATVIIFVINSSS